MRKSGAARNHHYLSNTAKCTDRQHLISNGCFLAARNYKSGINLRHVLLLHTVLGQHKKKFNTLTAQNQHDISNTEHNIVSDNTKYQHCSLQASQNYQR
jgi:hypothetical protein